MELILFLNKCDLLDLKLNSGIRLAKYVRSFGDRNNDSETAQRCEFFFFWFQDFRFSMDFGVQGVLIMVGCFSLLFNRLQE